MSYYVMECDGPYPTAAIAESPDLAEGPWLWGTRITTDVPEPLVYTLDPKRTGNLKALYEEPVPIAREDLVDALLSSGVDNLELFDAVIRDPATGAEHRNYKAFNVVGIVSCADVDASELMGTSDSAMIDVDFHSLVIDESKTGGARIFRLAEAVTALLVHERVKVEVEAREIPGMVFYASGEWSG